METQNQKIVAALDDLFFGVKISEAARRAGVAVEFVKDPGALMAAAALRPALIILDLNCTAVQPLESIARLKADPELGRVALVGYVSHVQAALRQKALSLGCDTV